MKITVFHVDAFTDRVFSGNPAAVCLLDEPLAENILQQIVYENNLPATTFLTRQASGFAIRWFTPEEINLCGHGTLAAGYVIFNYLEPKWHVVELDSRSGLLTVQHERDFITMDFPVKKIEPLAPAIQFSLLRDGLRLKQEPEDVLSDAAGERCVVVLKDEKTVKHLQPDFTILQDLNYRGVVVTAPGDTIDFVSRTFYPHKQAFPEDPVTGSSHSLLAPYWAERLNRHLLEAYQLSARGGFLRCQLQGDRVLLSSKAVLYMQGVISL